LRLRAVNGGVFRQRKISDEGDLQHRQREFLGEGIERRAKRDFSSIVLGSISDPLTPICTPLAAVASGVFVVAESALTD